MALSFINKNYDNPGIVVRIVEDVLEFFNQRYHIEDVFIAKTVRELAWGYEDKLLAFLHEDLGFKTINPTVGWLLSCYPFVSLEHMQCEWFIDAIPANK